MGVAESGGATGGLEAAGLVLAGGTGRRLGRDKASLRVGGEALVLRVLRVLGEADLAPRAVVAAPDQELPRLPFGVSLLRDRVAGEGPLQGLADGLAALRQRGAELVFAAACDLPLLTADFVRGVVEGLGGRRGLVPLDGRGRAHPLAAAYRCDLEPDLRALLAAGRREMRALLELEGVAAVETGAPGDETPELFNLNRPEDLLRLEEILRGE
jgi:molybdopterin-guanine dinucleotide biosynthesis protein A